MCNKFDANQTRLKQLSQKQKTKLESKNVEMLRVKHTQQKPQDTREKRNWAKLEKC